MRRRGLLGVLPLAPRSDGVRYWSVAWQLQDQGQLRETSFPTADIDAIPFGVKLERSGMGPVKEFRPRGYISCLPSVIDARGAPRALIRRLIQVQAG